MPYLASKLRMFPPGSPVPSCDNIGPKRKGAFWMSRKNGLDLIELCSYLVD